MKIHDATGELLLHPAMTAQQIAEWCARNDCYVEIYFQRRADSSVELLVLPHRIPSLKLRPPALSLVPASIGS